MSFSIKIPQDWRINNENGTICLEKNGRNYKSEGMEGMCGIVISLSDRYSPTRTNLREFLIKRKEGYQGTKVMSFF